MSFDDVRHRLGQIRTRVQAANVAAVRAGSQAILERALPNVPVDKGILYASGRIIEPTATPTGAHGGVTFGSIETETTWRGVGTEVFQEEGTQAHEETPKGNVLAFEDQGGLVFAKHVSNPGVEGVHFLERATLETLPELLEIQGEAFYEALQG